MDENKVKLEATKLPQFSFELEQEPLGAILQATATLAGYQFFVLPDELLIAQPQQLTLREREQAKPRNALQSSFAQSVPSVEAPKVTFAKPLTQDQKREAQANDAALRPVAEQLLASARKQGATDKPFAMRFDEFTPESQQKIQKLIDFQSRSFNLPLVSVLSDSLINLDKADTADVRFTLRIKASDPTTMSRAYAFHTDVSSGGDAESPIGTKYRLTPTSILPSQTPLETP